MCKIYSTGGSYTPGDEASMSRTGANCSKIVFEAVYLCLRTVHISSATLEERLKVVKI